MEDDYTEVATTILLLNILAYWLGLPGEIALALAAFPVMYILATDK
jgi:hypothetical protein